MINSYLSTEHEYLLLTRRSVMVFKRMLPVDQFKNICNNNSQDEIVDNFFSYFGADEVLFYIYQACTICIKLACENKIDASFKEKMIDYYISRGGVACSINSNPVQLNEKTVVGPNIVHSDKYNGLLKYIINNLNSYFSRIVYPFWDYSLFNKDVLINIYNQKQLNYSYLQLSHINNELLSLLKFFKYCETDNYDFLNYQYLDKGDSKTVDATSDENKNIYNLKTIAIRTQQFLQQLIIYYYKDNAVNEIFKKIDEKIQKELYTLTLAKIVSNENGKRLSNAIFQGFQDYIKTADNDIRLNNICDILIDKCGYYYSESDSSYNKGKKMLDYANNVRGDEKINCFNVYNLFILESL